MTACVVYSVIGWSLCLFFLSDTGISLHMSDWKCSRSTPTLVWNTGAQTRRYHVIDLVALWVIKIKKAYDPLRT